MINDTLNSIKNRRSIRAYKSEQLKDQELQTILEAGLYAPSAINQQSWHLTVIQNKEMLVKLNQSVKDFLMNSKMENFVQLASRPGFHVFHNAPTAIVVSGDTQALAPDADCAAAVENMLIAATAINVGSCWVDSIVHFLNNPVGEQLKNQLGIPNGYRPIHAVSLGYSQEENVQTPPRKMNAVNYVK